jgi:hypothetical protein
VLLPDKPTVTIKYHDAILNAFFRGEWGSDEMTNPSNPERKVL